jgi:hypothetical protein
MRPECSRWRFALHTSLPFDFAFAPRVELYAINKVNKGALSIKNASIVE